MWRKVSFMFLVLTLDRKAVIIFLSISWSLQDHIRDQCTEEQEVIISSGWGSLKMFGQMKALPPKLGSLIGFFFFFF